MDINQWLRQKVDNSEIHPAIADNFRFVYELFIKEQGNGTEEKLDTGSNQETRRTSRRVRSAKGQENTGGKTRRSRKKTGEVGATGEVSQDLKENEVSHE